MHVCMCVSNLLGSIKCRTYPTKQSHVPARHLPWLLQGPVELVAGQAAAAGGQSSGQAPAVSLVSASPTCRLATHDDLLLHSYSFLACQASSQKNLPLDAGCRMPEACISGF